MRKIAFIRAAFIAMTLILLLTVAHVHAASVANLDGSLYNSVEVESSGYGFYRSLITPSFALNGVSTTATSPDGMSTATSTYDFSSNNAFSVDVTHSLNGNGESAGSFGSIFFAVGVSPVTYSISGFYDVTSSTTTGRRFSFVSILTDVTLGTHLYHTAQNFYSPNTSFVIGGPTDTNRHSSLAGTLISGHQYFWSYGAGILDTTNSPNTGTGNFSLAFSGPDSPPIVTVDPPPAVPLPSAAWAGMALLSGLCISRYFHRKHVAA